MANQCTKSEVSSVNCSSILGRKFWNGSCRDHVPFRESLSAVWNLLW